MMRFSFAVSFSSEIVLTRSTHQTRLINSTTHHKNNTLAFNFSNHKDIHTPIFVSKQESIQFDERKSPNQVTLTHLLFSSSSQSFKKKILLQVKEEINQCYELINRLGRGIVYLGSSRMDSTHSHYVQAQHLAKEASQFLQYLPVSFLSYLLVTSIKEN